MLDSKVFRKLSIREYVAIAGIKARLCSSEYLLLSGWLGGYTYVLPEDRILDSRLIRKIFHLIPVIHHSTQIFKLWLVADWIQSSINQDEQQRIASWMPD